ncbi:MAG: hypothetical protein H0W51_01035 [Euzebyales bacterium]|nr:hypothetical protein [Euzebyales bacterium]
MAVNRLVHRVAARAAVPTFLLQGTSAGAPDDAEVLRLDPRVVLVDTPRHASVLLVAGVLPRPLQRPAALVHDALPHPRATVWWGGDTGPFEPGLAEAVPVPAGGDVVKAIVDVHRRLLLADLPSDAPTLTSTRRREWRGVGPYGHGGSGMTGGEPYGRPLADRADDLRDGLKLDVLPVTVGPFFPAFPPGLTLQVSLQGDLVQDVDVLPNPYLDHDVQRRRGVADPFDRAEIEAVRVADLELARVRHHLRRLAVSLRVLGLGALSVKALRLAARDCRRIVAEAPRLLATVERAGTARAVAAVGALPADAAAGLGLLARASGVAEDARSDDPDYQGLGLTVICQQHGHARARWMQRLAEIRQSLAIADRAGDRLRGPGAPLERPAPAAAEVLPLLPRLLVGAEWGDAVAVVASLDLDLRRDVAVPVAEGVG